MWCITLHISYVRVNLLRTEIYTCVMYNSLKYCLININGSNMGRERHKQSRPKEKQNRKYGRGIIRAKFGEGKGHHLWKRKEKVHQIQFSFISSVSIRE